MEALKMLSSVSPSYTSTTKLCKAQFSNFHFTAIPTNRNIPKKSCMLFTSLSSSSSSVEAERIGPSVLEMNNELKEEKFDWFSQWYPVMPVCDLDKRVPHAKRVLGLDLVVWWDRNENSWKVFDDMCPHRLAPLSEGRIDQRGRLQCVYHGWCFNGSGDCKFIPQAPSDGPPVHTFKKACVAVYPSIVHHDIVWFWPNTDPQYKDIIKTKKPPYIPELDDPSFTKLMGNRDIPYGYEVLLENLMDSSHVPYAHYGLIRTKQPKEKLDKEGGRPLEMSVKKIDVNGFIGKQEFGNSKYIAPCIFYASSEPVENQDNGSASLAEANKKLKQKRSAWIFICIPVSPGNSRFIWSFPRNFGIWIDKIVPRWMFHIGQNLIVDSDLYLLIVEEHKITDLGPANWGKACFVPTKADTFVVAYRRWLIKYAGGQFDWSRKFNANLPQTPPREQLMDRYWSHVVNCRSCNAAHKNLPALEVILQLVSIISIGIAAATEQKAMPAAMRNAVVLSAVACFAASKWLAHFVYKNFHYHDYNHAFR